MSRHLRIVTPGACEVAAASVLEMKCIEAVLAETRPPMSGHWAALLVVTVTADPKVEEAAAVWLDAAALL